MAQDTTKKNVPAATWYQITDANVSSITFQNLSSCVMKVKPTVGANAPTDDLGAKFYPKFQGERNIALTDLSPGVSGANRVYVYFADGGDVTVSHA